MKITNYLCMIRIIINRVIITCYFYLDKLTFGVSNMTFSNAGHIVKSVFLNDIQLTIVNLLFARVEFFERIPECALMTNYKSYRQHIIAVLISKTYIFCLCNLLSMSIPIIILCGIVFLK